MVTRRAQLLEFAVLGLLHEGPTHGYDLRRRLNEALGPFRALSYGTLYPALKSLLGRGLIAETADAARSAKRPRVVYELTAAGKEHFADLVARTDSSAYEDDGFDVRFAFFARTESEVRLRILEGRRSRLEGDLERLHERSVRHRERLDSYTAALQRHGEETTEREVRWLTELIDAERRHPTDPGPQP
ncbi:MAG: PadR family transcriptional regulator [Micrococcales bacterium]|uniref:PadR family transcriptional regulator n=1 Tax=Phycicoccus sp. TaxID=1902410 RepID=UPI0019C90ED3|nr:PadR family transcriptional regulator [Phycicoccus sp.]MBD3784712.1 PadR family transcriptional regulator [Micrococcales bacterium]HMM94895.1 PadR family transcriptional regulator [Phycicoccus sp.]